MKTTTGIFTSRVDAERAIADLRSIGYERRRRDFKTDESIYRRGFEAALHVHARGKSYEEAREHIRQHHADICDEEAFRRGYERGQSYYQSVKEKPQELRGGDEPRSES